MVVFVPKFQLQVGHLLDVVYFLQIPSSVKVVLIVITITAFILYLWTSALLFSILVHYGTKGIGLIKQAFTFSLIDVKTTFAIILMWLATGIVLFYAPLAICVIVVPVSMISFRFALILFRSICKLPRIQIKYITLEK